MLPEFLLSFKAELSVTSEELHHIGHKVQAVTLTLFAGLEQSGEPKMQGRGSRAGEDATR